MRKIGLKPSTDFIIALLVIGIKRVVRVPVVFFNIAAKETGIIIPRPVKYGNFCLRRGRGKRNGGSQ
jgi:hypothetical protein